jgi:hypothetical protein
MKPNIEFKSLLDGIRSIEERNRVFKTLSDEGKRLEIAWEVLKLLQKNVIVPSDGHYWDDDLSNTYETSQSAHELFKRFNNVEEIKGCSVCARGAIMLCQIRLGNTIDPLKINESAVADGTGYSFGEKHKVLDGFKLNDMVKMEYEYEFCRYHHPYEMNTREKLMNMMCNVLVNGNFNTEDKTDYLIF